MRILAQKREAKSVARDINVYKRTYRNIERKIKKAMKEGKRSTSIYCNTELKKEDFLYQFQILGLKYFPNYVEKRLKNEGFTVSRRLDFTVFW